MFNILLLLWFRNYCWERIDLAYEELGDLRVYPILIPIWIIILAGMSDVAPQDSVSFTISNPVIAQSVYNLNHLEASAGFKEENNQQLSMRDASIMVINNLDKVISNEPFTVPDSYLQTDIGDINNYMIFEEFRQDANIFSGDNDGLEIGRKDIDKYYLGSLNYLGTLNSINNLNSLLSGGYSVTVSSIPDKYIWQISG